MNSLGTTTAFSFGKTITTQQINFNNEIGRTTKVAQYPANGIGLYDMHGNVWEWTCSIYKKNYQEAERCAKANNTLHVLRGGSWVNLSRFMRSAMRFSLSTGRNNRIGFRLSLSHLNSSGH